LTLSLEEQLAFTHRKKEQAFARTLRAMKTNRDAIIALMPEGIEEGFEDYGDDSWHRSHAELTTEQLKELRDACNYQLFKMRQGWVT